MYIESHCTALDHNLVGLWFLSLHCGFLLCIGRCAGGRGACWWVVHGGVHCGFFLVCLVVAVSGCSRGLLLLWIMF